MSRRWMVIVGLGASLLASGLIVVIPALGSSPPSAESQVGAFAATSPSAAVGVSSVPGAVSSMMATLPGASANQGEPETADVHELMSGLGVDQASLYAYPTSSGSVCVVATEKVPVGTCVSSFDDPSTPISVAVYTEAGLPPSVVGVVPDSVVGVDVVVNGVSEPAELSGNGVYYQSPAGTPDSAISAVVAHYAGGTSETQSFASSTTAPAVQGSTG